MTCSRFIIDEEKSSSSLSMTAAEALLLGPHHRTSHFSLEVSCEVGSVLERTLLMSFSRRDKVGPFIIQDFITNYLSWKVIYENSSDKIYSLDNFSPFFGMKARNVMVLYGWSMESYRLHEWLLYPDVGKKV